MNMTNFYVDTAITNHTQPSYRHPTSPRFEWYWTVQAVIALLNIMCNGSVICVIVAKQTLHTAPNWFILSLAIADFSMASLVFPMELNCTFGSCSRWAFKILRDIFLLSSTANLMFVVLDRFFAVVYPLKYHRFATSRKVFLCIGVSWCSSILFPVTMYLVHHFGYRSAFRIYRITFGVTWLIVLNLSLLVWSIKVLRVAKRQRKRVSLQFRQLKHNYKADVSIQRFSRTERHASSSVKLIGALIALFVCCSWLAFYNDFHNYILKRIVSMPLYVAGHILLPLNSVLNALVYAFLKKDIRREIIKIYCNRKTVQKKLLKL